MTRPRPVASLFALGLLAGWPVLAWALVRLLVDPMHCGFAGLSCAIGILIACLMGWVGGALCAIAALKRGERRPFALSMLGLNLLPLVIALSDSIGVLTH
ncbi:hypothetical protein [Luteimonas sp. 3794]|uniref:hypothetical protein n=1 Tax=Luteimonas sp. 3794 TaxID=2817730 RepID=UPI00285BCEAB|nr:hypothetical protein [Luteimonas sp. 3794]MDR6992364.1 hypothetical protein [Luteimonas sp. 3794]